MSQGESRGQEKVLQVEEREEAGQPKRKGPTAAGGEKRRHSAVLQPGVGLFT